MDEKAICAAYQRLIRQSYPGVIVRRSVEDWVPVDNVYHAFFIPDDAAGHYIDHWLDEHGWGDQAEKLGLPRITLIPTYESDTRKHYAHLFPDVLGGMSTGSAKSRKSKNAPKTRAARNVPVAVKQ